MFDMKIIAIIESLSMWYYFMILDYLEGGSLQNGRLFWYDYL